MNIKQALSEGTNKLKTMETNSARIDAEILLAHTLNKSREYLLTYPEKKISKGQFSNFLFFIKKRLDYQPIAYIIGHKSFYGLDFMVNEDCLVPRPETELMVEEVIKIAEKLKQTTIIDIGTGSGCIIVSLAKNLKSIFKYLAIDISVPTLKIAQKNAEINKVSRRIKFFHGNLLKPLIQKDIIEKKENLIITANLPYLTPNQVNSSLTIQNEPILALVAGDDGLKYYRQLFTQINQLKTEKEISGYLLCEIDPSQTDSIEKLIKDTLTYKEFNKKQDLAGLDRLVIIKV
jgi:release factor glutamine methyltransferase